MTNNSSRVALITGASRGIGLVIARHLCAQGVRCILLARDREALEAGASSIRAEGGIVDVLPLDLEFVESPAMISAKLGEVTSQLDVLIVNAALGGIRVPLPEYPAELWRRLFQVNVHAVQMLLASVHPMLTQSEAGRVVFVSTGVARRWKAHTGAYGASKAALEAIAGIYAVETCDSAIRSNIVNPGATRTDMRAAAFPDENADRLKSPDDIAQLFVELCSTRCSSHGAVIDADAWLSTGQNSG